MKKKQKTALIAALVFFAALLMLWGLFSLRQIRAVSPQGTVLVSQYAFEDGESGAALPDIEDPWADRGIIHIRGTLPKEYDTSDVRVALIPEEIAQDESVRAQDEAMLLRTSIERAQTIGEDGAAVKRSDFSACVRRDALKGQGWQYHIVLADTTNDGKRMIETNMRIVAIDGGLAYIRRNLPETQAEDAAKKD